MSLFESASLVVTPNGTKASKLYSIKPTDGSGDLSVTRATTATRVNSSGLIESVSANVPRLDYSNGSCPSILVEPQRTNKVLYSEQFDNAAWDKINVTVTANNIISPDGTINADKIEYTNVNNYFITYSTNNQNTSYTISAYAKKGTTDLFSLREVFYFGSTARFDLTNGTIVSDTTGTAKIQNVGNGWFRCSITQAYTSGQTNVQWSFDNRTSTGNLYLWGAQLEAGSYATSYIPTTSSSVTRNADVISKTGISSLIGQTEGTIFLDFNINNISSQTNEPVILSFSDGCYIEIYSNGGVVWNDSDGGIAIVLLGYGLTNGRHKFAIGYAANNTSLYIDGNLAGSDNTGTPTSKSYINFGYNTQSYIGSVKYNSAVLWKERLTNTELATLTTL